MLSFSSNLFLLCLVSDIIIVPASLEPIVTGTNVQVWQCNPKGSSAKRQQWKIDQGNYPNRRISLRADSKVLDIEKWSNDSEANLQVNKRIDYRNYILFDSRFIRRRQNHGISNSFIIPLQE